MEILFLVYKIGWWGCMDSLYREYSAREDCNCSVVVTPCYERDRKNGEILYDRKVRTEGSLPEGVKPTPAEEYDIEKRRPAKIFIHNPFDGANPVESVAVSYYSERLKQYTQELIYVPHLLYRSYLSEEFQHCPAYENVDRIYLPSEKMRCAFDVRYDEKLEIRESGIGEYLNRLGEEQQTAGDKKLRVLYCVDYADLYYNTDRQLDKMEYVFSFFRGRTDAELVFRPDEDILRCERTLQPAVLRRYMTLLLQFKERGGIVDVSDDIYAASVQADVFMGSVYNQIRNLFAVQKKQSLILGVECPEAEEYEHFFAPEVCACHVEGDEVTFATTGQCNFLCRLNLTNGKVRLLRELPGGIWNGIYSVFKENGRYWMLLSHDKALLSYEEDSNRLEKYYVPVEEDAKKIFWTMVPYKQYLFLIPGSVEKIWRFDRTTGQFQGFGGWAKQIREITRVEDRSEMLLTRKLVAEGNWLHIPSSCTNAILHFDMDTGESSLERVGEPGEKFISLWKNGKRELLLPFKGNTIYFRDAERSERWRCWRTTDKQMRAPYIEACQLDERYVAIFPGGVEDFLRLDLEQMMIEPAWKENRVCFPETLSNKFLRAYGLTAQVGNDLLTYSYFDGKFVWMDRKLQFLQSFTLRLPEKPVLQAYARKYEKYIRECSRYYEVNEAYPLEVILAYWKKRPEL